MRRVMLPIIALSLAAAPLALEAQTPGAERSERGQFAARGAGVMNPAERVLQQREALGLTMEQVRQLQQLQAQHAAQNQPLVEQLQAARLARLTPEQRAQVEQRRAQMAERRAQMANATPEERQRMREAMRQQRDAVRQQMRERREQLTPEQRAELRQKMQAERGQRGQRGAMRPGGRQLSPEARAEMEALRPVMEQLRSNQVQARQQVEAVLTAEQVAKLRELQVQRRGEMRGSRPGGRR